MTCYAELVPDYQVPVDGVTSDVAANPHSQGMGPSFVGTEGQCSAPQPSAAELDMLWEYADDRGRIQGPFSARKLLGWLQAVSLKQKQYESPRLAVQLVTSIACCWQGALKPNRKVRAHGMIDFTPMDSISLFAGVLAAALPKPPPIVSIHQSVYMSSAV